MACEGGDRVLRDRWFEKLSELSLFIDRSANGAVQSCLVLSIGKGVRRYDQHVAVQGSDRHRVSPNHVLGCYGGRVSGEWCLIKLPM
jgi:hypothetical protein